MDDLDALLEDLGRPKTATNNNAKKPRAPSSKVDLNELEDLMQDLAAPSNPHPPPQVKPAVAKPVVATVRTTPTPAPAKPAFSKPAPPPAAAPAPAVSSYSAADTDDLDALMASLNSTSSRESVRAAPMKVSNPVTPPPPAAAPYVEPAYAPPPLPPRNTPPQPTPTPQVAVAATTMDDLDELLSNLEPAKPAVVQPARMAAAPTPTAPAAVSSQNSFGNAYTANGSYTPPAARPPVTASPTTRAPPAAAAPLTGSGGSSRVGGGGGGGGAAGSAKPMGGDDLDNLLKNLTTQMKDIDRGGPASRGTCATCHNPILGEVIQALGNTYHPEHFVCGNCQNPLGTNNFYEQDGLPHCEKCYQELFCARCAHCDEPILDRCVTALNKKWHINHFICTQCLGPFEGGTFFEKDSRPYCESCFYAAFASKCGSCNQPIRGECINALGQQWHPEHFVCQYCQKSFAGGAFYEHGGKPYCEVHYHQQTGSLCAGCGKAITGRVVNALDKKWHPEHFVCAFCMNPLAGGSFTENNGKAYCKECHGKLFG